MAKELSALESLVKHLSALPGFGRRSARRAALHLLLNKDSALTGLVGALEHACDSITECAICGNLDEQAPCRICTEPKRGRDVLCVVEGVSDIWAVERTQSYNGQYHVLGGVLSPLDGVSPEDLRIDALLSRLKDGAYSEVILAMGATVNGQTTAHYLADEIHAVYGHINITRLAHGVPVGGELDYLDEGTISTALKSRAAL
ncbi:MAG: recombination mediator RecR [Alphaproteobacteria bacterium]|nr:recombination mediator RecR [Alphaproteobacteria bacterium]